VTSPYLAVLARLLIQGKEPGCAPLPVSAFLNTVRDRAPVDLWIGLVIARPVN